MSGLVPDLQMVEPMTGIVGRIVQSPMILMYIGPDQLMPLTSVIGAIVGAALMMWGRIVDLTRRLRSAVDRRFRSSRTGSID